MAELEPQEHYFVAVDKNNTPVGGVYREEEYAQGVLEAAYSRDSSHVQFHDDMDIARQTAQAGYQIKRCKIVLVED